LRAGAHRCTFCSIAPAGELPAGETQSLCLSPQEHMSDWKRLDAQLARWSSKLTDDLGISPRDASRLATVIAREVSGLTQGSKTRLLAASRVPLQDRLSELQAFEAWMGLASAANTPAVTRAQVITQNYVCFVYLRDDWFHILREVAAPGCATSRSATFLTEDPVRAFRNAFSHGNWRYRDDFAALQFWARRNGKGPEVEWQVEQTELEFWQALSRCLAYASIQTLADAAA